jgi:hypothetical protein
MLLRQAPGKPAWQVDAQTLQTVLHESLNFFYVNIGLHQIGIDAVPSIAEHPVDEALFNVVNAWGLLFLPLLAADAKTQRSVRAWQGQWVAAMLLTNVFFIPLLAQRAAPQPHAPGLAPAERTAASLSPAEAAARGRDVVAAQARAEAEAQGLREHEERWRGAERAVGGVAAAVGAFSIAWALVGRPEYGALAQRADFAVQHYSNDRVFYAFVVDAGLYGFWQAWLMGDAGAPRRFCAVPFFGLAAWLLAGRPRE